jgi:hypothetical protein
VPRPGAATTSTRPPTVWIRSRRLVRPAPGGVDPGSKPRPVSLTLNLSCADSSASFTVTVASPPACLAAFWIDSRQQRYTARLPRCAPGSRCAVQGLAGLLRLVVVPVWLLGTLILLIGYATQGAALGRGRLVVVQPLLVTTIVWALPLGHWLTSQHVARRQVAGAGVVVIGLALFVLVGDPDAGVDNASTAKRRATGGPGRCSVSGSSRFSSSSSRWRPASSRPRWPRCPSRTRRSA